MVEIEQYTTKPLVDSTIKINCQSPESYQKRMKYKLENNEIHPNYEAKDENAFRMVIKHTKGPKEVL